MENRDFEKTRESMRFDSNILSFYREHKPSDNPRFKTIAAKRGYLLEHLTHDGMIEWCLQHDIGKWQRFTWSDIRKFIGQTDLWSRKWPIHIVTRLMSLLHLDLRCSREFASLCNCMFS